MLVFVSFAPALSAEFLDFDDDKLFTLNQRWRGLGETQLTWMLSTGLMGHWQPLTWLSFGADHALYGLTAPLHPEAGAYHATSLVLHGLTVLAFFWLAERLFALALPALDERRRMLAAAFAAALWAVHPMRVESVVWLTERRDVLSSLFAVLAARAWLGWAPVGAVRLPARGPTIAIVGCSLVAALAVLRGLDLGPGELRVASWPLLALGFGAWMASIALVARGSDRAPAYVAACACLVLSLGAKAWGMVLPAVLLILDVWPLRRMQASHTVALIVEKLPLVVPAVIVARLAHWAQSNAAGVMKTWDEHSLEARLAQALYGLVYYPLRSLLPIDLSPLYDLPASMSLAEPRWLVPALAAVAAGVGALALWRRAPALGVACLVYAILVSPVLGFVQSGPQLVADRYAHLSTMPLVLLLAGVAAWLSRTHAVAVSVVGVVLLLASGVATWRQSIVWQTSSSLWEHAYAIAPQSAPVLNSLGTLRSKAAQQAPDPVAALALLQEAASLHEQSFTYGGEPLPLRNLSQVHGLMAVYDPANAQRHHADALEFSRRALELAEQRRVATPDYVLSYGTDLVNVGRLDEGIERLRWYVGVEPDRFRGLVNLGGALTMAGRAGEALPLLERACRLEPVNSQAWVALARAQSTLGRRDAALASLRRAVALSPGDVALAQLLRSVEQER